MEFCIFQAGTESIALWKDVPKLATVTDNAKPIMLSNGNVGANPDGSERDAIFRWNRIVPTARTMTEVSNPQCGKTRQENSQISTLSLRNFFDERHYNDASAPIRYRSKIEQHWDLVLVEGDPINFSLKLYKEGGGGHVRRKVFMASLCLSRSSL